MALTTNDVVNEALAYLRVIEIGEAPAADDVTAASGVFSQLVGEWTGNRICDVDPNNVNPNYLQPASRLLANRIAPKFGRPGDPDLDIREQQRLLNLQTKYSRRRGVGAVAL